MLEIERKFMAIRPADASNHPWSIISQGYMAVSSDGTEVRLREECPRLPPKVPRNIFGWLTLLAFRLAGILFPKSRRNRYSLTVKSGGEKTRTETEIEITSKQFNALWPATRGKQLKKIRYQIPYGNLTIELDVYLGRFDGLVVAEVEFDSEKGSNDFILPDWFGKEVTEDPHYKNKNIALRGLPSK